MNAETRRQYEKLLCHYKNMFTHHQMWLNHCKEVIASLEKDLTQEQCTLTPEGKVIPVPSREELRDWGPGRFVFDRAGHLVDRSVGDAKTD